MATGARRDEDGLRAGLSSWVAAHPELVGGAPGGPGGAGGPGRAGGRSRRRPSTR